MNRTIKNLARSMPARELVDQLVGRLGAAETCRRLRLPATTDLHQFADTLDSPR
jgi:hypothetical protein